MAPKIPKKMRYLFQSRVRGLVCNDDFTDRLTDVPFFMRTRRLAFALVQEAKATDLEAVFDSERYFVRQRMETKAEAGVGVVVDTKQASLIAGDGDFLTIGGGGILLISQPDMGIMGRYLVWQDVILGARPKTRFRRRRAGRPTRLASFHRNPGRADEAWPLQDARVADHLLLSPLPVLLGMDCNERGGPTGLMRRLRHMRWHGIEIDGVVAPGSWKVKVRRFGKRHSDHHALQVTVELNQN